MQVFLQISIKRFIWRSFSWQRDASLLKSCCKSHFTVNSSRFVVALQVWLWLKLPHCGSLPKNKKKKNVKIKTAKSLRRGQQRTCYCNRRWIKGLEHWLSSESAWTAKSNLPSDTHTSIWRQTYTSSYCSQKDTVHDLFHYLSLFGCAVLTCNLELGPVSHRIKRLIGRQIAKIKSSTGVSLGQRASISHTHTITFTHINSSDIHHRYANRLGEL